MWEFQEKIKLGDRVHLKESTPVGVKKVLVQEANELLKHCDKDYNLYDVEQACGITGKVFRFWGSSGKIAEVAVTLILGLDDKRSFSIFIDINFLEIWG